MKFYIATEPQDFTIPEKMVLLSPNEPSCLNINIIPDAILEYDEEIVMSVFPSAADASVVVISPVQSHSVLTIEDDDSKWLLECCNFIL